MSFNDLERGFTEHKRLVSPKTRTVQDRLRCGNARPWPLTRLLAAYNYSETSRYLAITGQVVRYPNGTV